MGFHLAGTPNVDVNTNPDNPIINLRSLGDRVELVIELGEALCRAPTTARRRFDPMHFPGHGATGEDSHITMAEVRRSLAELESVDVKPFAELGGAAAWPASYALTTATIRPWSPSGECRPQSAQDHYRPVARVAGLSRRDHVGQPHDEGHEGQLRDRGGCDPHPGRRPRHDPPGLQLRPQDHDRRPGPGRARERVPLKQVEDSIRRVWKLKGQLGLFENRLADPAKVAEHLATAEHRAVARRIARESVTVLENRGLPPGRAADCCW